ncbi:hypothetical protein EW146_g779 [Bondarzewia mesenterica]|uniref:Dynactin subunit 4 n=1 Tax=Bondarzewia mesenterica TaxID=1095465 RepID=A0A4S4M5V2_9AGAM|nr:hypothetical protein EW146_g779 [Bondarzewia mesenterica]
MPPSVQYHCPCLTSSNIPPQPHLSSSSYSFHPLHELYFCEECDAVRCNHCVSIEVSGYYCPNCLFEVPSASVRAEKNRCARNCFLCPNCRNTLSVVPSDPPDVDDGRPSSIAVNAVGEPPFFLYCNHCRWDSAEVDITFEKPTGLAAQLQKYEDSAPESLEFERLKEHFEPFLRASSSAHPSTASHSHHSHVNPITAAASSALARDIPGVAKYMPHPRTRHRDKGAKDEMPEYRSRVEIGTAGAGGEQDVEFMQHIEEVNEVAALEQRWANSWATSLRTRDLRPLRIPLHSKKSKRCPTCRHILIKPEQKAQSVRYKIKLVAANYLPAIKAVLPHSDTARRVPGSKMVSAEDTSGANGMMAGKTDIYLLRLHRGDAAYAEKARRPPFAVSLPSSAFPIAAFAEAWEYEDDEDMFGVDDDEFGLAGKGGRAQGAKSKTVGVLEKRANVTIVGGEVMIGKDAKGEVKFNMLVSYTYRSDDPLPEDDSDGSIGRNRVHDWAPSSLSFYSFDVIVEIVYLPGGRSVMASTSSAASSSAETAQALGVQETRAQAGPLPYKRGEIGYQEDIHGRAQEGRQVEVTSLPERHPADHPPSDSVAAANPTRTLPTTPPNDASSTHSESKRSIKSFLISTKVSTCGGISLTTILLFLFQLAFLAGTVASWVIAVKVLGTKANNNVDSANGSTVGNGASFIFVHVAFGIAVLAQLRDAPNIIPPHAIPPECHDSHRTLATSAAAYVRRGPCAKRDGTGDAEDSEIARPPPPAYGHTRGSRLLLAGFLRESLRGQVREHEVDRDNRMSARSDRPVSFVSRDEEWEERRDAERARRVEEALAQLEEGRSTR